MTTVGEGWLSENDARTLEELTVIEHKSFAPAQFKLSEAGQIEVAFSQLGVIDREADITMPGALPAKSVPMSAYGHSSWTGELPIGKGTIREESDWGIFAGQFLMGTDQGRNAYQTVKEMGELQDWSYAYAPLDFAYETRDGEMVRLLKRLDVFEVSPVIVGAGVGTHTRSIKAASKAAIASHSTPTDEGEWDAGMMVARCPATAAALRALHAWVDPDGDPDAKGSYKFPHHMVNEDGDVGAASLVACSAGIAVLNGGRGGADIPDADREGVWRHLARHLRDGERDVPELRGPALVTGARLADAVDRFLADGGALSTQFRSMAELRVKEGRTLSAANRTRLAAIRDAIAEILAETDPEKAAQPVLALLEEARFLGVPINHH